MALDWFGPWPTLIDALATYRLTRLLVTDQLPPVATLRNRLYQRTAARSPQWAVGWVCAWCLGFWVAVVVVGAHTLAALGGSTGANLFTLLMLPFAYSTVAGVLADRQAT